MEPEHQGGNQSSSSPRFDESIALADTEWQPPAMPRVVPLPPSLQDGSPRSLRDEADMDAAAMAEAARGDVIDTTLGDMEELCNDVEATSVYAIRTDMLRAWSVKLRTMLRTLREGGVQTLARGGKKSCAVMRGASHVVGSVMRRRGSFANVSTTSAAVDDALSRARLVEGGARVPHSGHRSASGEMGAAATTTAAGGGSGAVPIAAAQHASGALYLLLDALCQSVAAEWATAFVYRARQEELVLVASAGSKRIRPGGVRLAAGVGVEGHVLSSGIAVNLAHAYAEEEFSPAQDAQTATRTKATVVFPLSKPNNASAMIGVLEVGNKAGAVTFSADDEARVGECARLASHIICAFPADITNPNAFDPALLPSHEADRLPPLASVPPVRGGTKIFRTRKLGHLRRQEVLRDAAAFPQLATIQSALDHVTQMNESWRQAVMLNVELEGEIRRLHEGLRVGRREITRLQDVVQDLRRQLEHAEALH